ncbi:TPA: hypothetical protein ACGOZB_002133, partial [Streptococcus suis]
IDKKSAYNIGICSGSNKIKEKHKEFFIMKKTFVTLATVAALVAAAAPVVTSALETNTTSKVTLRVGDYNAQYQVKFTQLKDAEARLNGVNDKLNVVVDGINEQNAIIAQYGALIAAINADNANASAKVNREEDADASKGDKATSAQTELFNKQQLEAAQLKVKNAQDGLAVLEADKAALENEKAAIIAEMTKLQGELDALAAEQDGTPANNGGAAAPAGNGAATSAGNGKAAAKTVAAAKTATGAKTLPKTSAAK